MGHADLPVEISRELRRIFDWTDEEERISSPDRPKALEAEIELHISDRDDDYYVFSLSTSKSSEENLLFQARLLMNFKSFNLSRSFLSLRAERLS